MRHLYNLSRLDRQRGALRRCDHHLLHSRDPFSKDAAAANVELGEHIVEQQQRLWSDQLGLGEKKREQCQPLLPL
jgi:hypothetical protein